MIQDLKFTEISKMVDLAREDRIEKWDKFLSELREFHKSTDSEVLYIGKPALKAAIDDILSKTW